MSDYTDKKALLDTGYLIGYFEQAIASKAIEDEDESFHYLLERIYDLATRGRLYDDQPDDEAERVLVVSIGRLKGRVWHTPIANAVSHAIDLLCQYYANTRITGDEHLGEMTPCQHPGDKLSDHQRQQIYHATLETHEDTSSAEFADELALPHGTLLEFWRSEGCLSDDEVENELNSGNSPVTDANQKDTSPTTPPDSSGQRPSEATGRGAREWTPEHRAAQADRARNYAKANVLIPDDDLGKVKADFDAGLSFAKIGEKWNCSGSHVRNFLKKHGIDPRRGRGSDKKAADFLIIESAGERVARALEPAGPGQPQSTGLPDASPAARWKPSPIDAAEWPDIQKRLAAGDSREAIASDYDVPPEDLDAFIQERLAEGRQRRGESPGESPAPLH